MRRFGAAINNYCCYASKYLSLFPVGEFMPFTSLWGYEYTREKEWQRVREWERGKNHTYNRWLWLIFEINWLSIPFFPLCLFRKIDFHLIKLKLINHKCWCLIFCWELCSYHLTCVNKFHRARIGTLLPYRIKNKQCGWSKIIYI